MLALASILLSWAMGWAVARRLLGRESWNPAWLRWILEILLGWAAGTAISSLCYFLLLWIDAPPHLSPVIEILVLAGCLLRLRLPREAAPNAATTTPGSPWIWMLRLGAVVTLGLFLLSFAAMAKCQPDGGWDALFIWNVRAKFLASGDQNWRTAITPSVNGLSTPVGHPDYPLLTSAFLGRTWWFGDPSDPSVPVACSLIYSLALVGLLGSALAWLSSETAGLLAMLALLSCDLLVVWSAAQYADIPLALSGLGSLVLMAAARARNWPAGVLLLSGLLGGAACWTKNEGIPLLLGLLAAGLLFGGVRVMALMAAGAAPLAGVAAALHLLLAPASSAMLPASLPEAAARLAEPGRWGLIVTSFAGNFLNVSHWWAHPVLLLGAAAFALGLVAAGERMRLWRLAIAPLGLLAADFGVLLVTSADLAWNLDTATDRLLLQALPSLMFVFAITLRTPSAAAPAPAPKIPRKSRKRKG